MHFLVKRANTTDRWPLSAKQKRSDASFMCLLISVFTAITIQFELREISVVMVRHKPFKEIRCVLFEELQQLTRIS